jgi:hypothetical protein
MSRVEISSEFELSRRGLRKVGEAEANIILVQRKVTIINTDEQYIPMDKWYPQTYWFQTLNTKNMKLLVLGANGGLMNNNHWAG